MNKITGQYKSQYVYLGFMLLILSASALANDWRLDKDTEGIQVYTRAVASSKIRQVKAEITIDTSLDIILAVFSDISHYPQWNHENSQAWLLQHINQSERYSYQDFTMPFPVKDRDLILHSVVTEIENGVILRTNAAADYCKSSTIAACEKVRQSKNIMVNLANGEHQFIVVPGKGVKLIWQQHVEPAGKIPNWLVNQLLVDVPFNTLNNLRAQVKLDKYKAATVQD